MAECELRKAAENWLQARRAACGSVEIQPNGNASESYRAALTRLADAEAALVAVLRGGACDG